MRLEKVRVALAGGPLKPKGSQHLFKVVCSLSWIEIVFIMSVTANFFLTDEIA
jgi:hypothetical protein